MNAVDVEQAPEKALGPAFAVFQKRGDQGSWSPGFTFGGQSSFASGKGLLYSRYIQMQRGLLRRIQCWLLCDPTLRVCDWRLQRSNCE